MIARLPLPVLRIFAIFGGCHLFAAEPVMLWDPAVPLPRTVDMPVIAGTRLAVIEPYEFNQDGYRFLHGVGLAWHKNRLSASFGHNRGPKTRAVSMTARSSRIPGPSFRIHMRSSTTADSMWATQTPVAAWAVSATGGNCGPTTAANRP
jgi:hypothetical protein